ncbi:MAG: UDP-N-acetylglucosamine 1-carboxyvinyltransferase [Clostridia bacterium]|jgi:UDP-N-acetylglucosamine 1-carboxyvinyltransferase|nr:UDP-N-acetylglucosamine 1-carboxyvinyltransferase [Clostridia bacterium]
MKKIIINGGRKLRGDISVSGMKNAALPIVFATILSGDECILENLPDVTDVALSLKILEDMGATVRTTGRNAVAVDTSRIGGDVSDSPLVGRLRASTYLLGALLGRFGEALVGFSGGCDFGVRPIDQHIKGFQALGAEVRIENGCNHAFCPHGGLHGGSVYLDIASVGATINVMLAAVTAAGKTTIDNAAREPHIVDLANFLNMCGARISGAGTSFIKITGVEKLHGCSYTIIPDMIEAGTYMVAAAATGGRVTVRGVIPKHMETVTAKLQEMGAGIDEKDDAITVSRSSRLTRANIKTYFYPGFPTDMHPQFGALLATAEGTSIITEGVFDNRFRYVDELAKMNADIKVEGRTATVIGRERLTGAPVKAVDLRAGAALIIAGLAAEGTTEISGVETIERGYDDIVGKLRGLGADIRMIECENEPEKETPDKAG